MSIFLLYDKIFSKPTNFNIFDLFCLQLHNDFFVDNGAKQIIAVIDCEREGWNAERGVTAEMEEEAIDKNA